MSAPVNHLYEFGPFRLDPSKRVLLRQGAVVSLPPKVFDTLLVLVEHRGRVLEKDELMNRLWPDTIVEEGNLKVHISHLRKALGESASSHQYIVTIPGRGYRFVADVTEIRENEVEVVLERERSGRIVVEEEEEENGRRGEWENGRRGAQVSPRLLTPSPTHPFTHSLFRWLALLSIIGLGAAAMYLWALRPSKPSGPALTVKSIAVLPFKPLSAEESDVYLGLGMADTLITKLSSVRQLIVRPTSAVLKYAGPDYDPLAAGREQWVDAVLEGTTQRAGDRIRVRVRLINVRDEVSLRTFQCDEHQCADIFAMQDAISEQVAEALMLTLTDRDRQRLAKHYTENRAAYQAYTKGVYFSNLRTSEGFKKALEYFQQATELDPHYALAYAALASVYNNVVWWEMDISPALALAKAKEAATTALELDETLAEAHAAMSGVYRSQWDWPNSLRELEQAMELSPGSAETHHWYAYQLIQMGRAEEAITEINRALELDPLNIPLNVDVGESLLYARRYDEAIEALKKALEMDPHRGNALDDLAVAYEQNGRHDQAIAAYLKVETIVGSSPQLILAYQAAYAAAGMKGYWQKKLERRLEESKRSNVSPFYIAEIYAHLGQNDQAFAWLEKAYQQHSPHLTNLKADPLFDPLHSDPRFAELRAASGWHRETIKRWNSATHAGMRITGINVFGM
jgi:DNA-binding winged helix-turn-helix (wHTH) protein/TolB-like protein/cytochrome c-type biogenesis protein CcmH/NrfG